MEKNRFETPEIESQTIERLSTQLLEAHAALTQSQKERSQMIANLSHDLRAPMTAIRSTVDLLLQKPDMPEADRNNLLQLIDRRTNTLESMIEDIYYLFSVEDTTKELEFQKMSAPLFLEEYFFDASIDSRYEEYDMQLDIPEDMDCDINIDIHKFIRVLDNLMTNAAKYNPQGTKIKLKATQDTNKKLIHISISDNGIGIEKDAIENIFTRTYRVDSARTPGKRKISGSGLGLSIAKAIVERHNGEIKCESTVGIGSDFIITLPTI